MQGDEKQDKLLNEGGERLEAFDRDGGLYICATGQESGEAVDVPHKTGFAPEWIPF